MGQSVPTRSHSLFRRRPQFDPVSLGIHDPGESPVVVVFTMWVNFNAFSLQCFEQPIQVIDSVVDHEAESKRAMQVRSEGLLLPIFRTDIPLASSLVAMFHFARGVHFVPFCSWRAF